MKKIDVLIQMNKKIIYKNNFLNIGYTNLYKCI